MAVGLDDTADIPLDELGVEPADIPLDPADIPAALRLVELPESS